MKLVVATPTFGGQSFDLWRRCMRDLERLCLRVGLPYFDMSTSDPSCPRCRNDLLHAWYMGIPDSDDLLFIDADIVFDPQDVLEMCSLEHPLVGMAYPYKKLDFKAISEAERQGLPGEAFASKLVVQLQPGAVVDSDGTLPVEYLATGMMRIKRSLIDLLIKDIATAPPSAPWVKQMAYKSDTPQTYGQTVYNWFQMPVVDEPNWGPRLLSEDWFFSRLCMDRGIQPRLFVGTHRPANLGHVGLHVYRGSVATALPWGPREQEDAVQERGPETEVSCDGREGRDFQGNRQGIRQGFKGQEASRAQETKAPRMMPLPIPGWYEDILPFYDFIESQIPQGGRTCHVGVFLGGDLAYMGKLRPDLQHVAVDLWEDKPSQGYNGAGCHEPAVRMLGGLWNGFQTLMKAHAPGTLQRTQIFRATSTDVELPVDLDFVFIDAAHDYESVVRDIFHWKAQLKPGGILAGHDFSSEFPGVVKAVTELVPGFQVHGTCWWAKKPVEEPTTEDLYDNVEPWYE